MPVWTNYAMPVWTNYVMPAWTNYVMPVWTIYVMSIWIINFNLKTNTDRCVVMNCQLEHCQEVNEIIKVKLVHIVINWGLTWNWDWPRRKDVYERGTFVCVWGLTALNSLAHMAALQLYSIEPPTFCKPVRFDQQRWAAGDLMSTTLTTRWRRPTKRKWSKEEHATFIWTVSIKQNIVIFKHPGIIYANKSQW